MVKVKVRKTMNHPISDSQLCVPLVCAGALNFILLQFSNVPVIFIIKIG